MGPDPTRRLAAPSRGEVPHRRDGVRRAVAVAATSQDPDRIVVVQCPVGAGQDEGATAFGRGGAVEEVEGIRDQR